MSNSVVRVCFRGGLYRALALALLTCVLSMVLGPVYGQEASASVTGRVTDVSGAAVASASVIVRDKLRGTSFPTVTNEEGIYVIPRLPIGDYELRVESLGFKTFVASNLTLEINQRARIDAQLEIGAVSENVQVTGEAALLQTETTQVGSVINSRAIQNIPLLSQNFLSLTLLSPGVSITDPSTLITGQRSTGGGRPQVNGNRAQSNNFLLDGIDNNQSTDNLVSYQPTPDAIQEFKLITNNAAAEFGNYQGGIINITIKGGTNQFHGDVFDFFRNDVLNANNWARNWQGTPKTPVRWNTFGGTLGGPIKRDRLFFFVDYQGNRKVNPAVATSITSMPQSFRNGDFSALLALPKPIQLYNPFSLDASGNRVPFQNNQIPLSLRDPAASAILTNTTLYPLPPTNDLRFNQLNYVGSSITAE